MYFVRIEHHSFPPQPNCFHQLITLIVFPCRQPVTDKICRESKYCRAITSARTQTLKHTAAAPYAGGLMKKKNRKMYVHRCLEAIGIFDEPHASVSFTVERSSSAWTRPTKTKIKIGSGGDYTVRTLSKNNRISSPSDLFARWPCRRETIHLARASKLGNLE